METNLLLKFIKKYLIYLLGDDISKSFQFNAAHANFMLIMVFSSFEGDINKISNYQPMETSLRWFSSINLYFTLGQFSGRHRNL